MGFEARFCPQNTFIFNHDRLIDNFYKNYLFFYSTQLDLVKKYFFIYCGEYLAALFSSFILIFLSIFIHSFSHFLKYLDIKSKFLVCEIQSDCR